MTPFLVTLALSASAAALVPLPLQTWSADSIQWQENRPGGTQRAVLEGDLARTGPVTYAFHLPDGAWFPPHQHSSDARVFVLKGTLLLGQGNVIDQSKVLEVKAGEAVFVPHGLIHFEGARGDTVLIGTTMGPFTTVFFDRPAR